MAFELSTPFEEARELSALFDTARFVPIAADASLMDDNAPENRWDGKEVFYLPEGHKMKQLARWRAVVNNRTNEVANIVTSRYGIIQHDLAARLVMEALMRTGMGEGAKYEVINGGNWTRIRARFPDVTVKDGSRGGLHLGVQFGNNYAEGRSFGANMMAWRQICSNGAIITKVIPGTTFNIRHVQGRVNEQDLERRIYAFAENVGNATAKVSDLVEATRATEVSFKNSREVELTIAEIVERIHAPEPILAAIPLQTDAYTVFNAVTDWASHNPKLSNMRREYVLGRASSRLLGVEEVHIITPEEMDPAQMVLRELTEV